MRILISILAMTLVSGCQRAVPEWTVDEDYHLVIPTGFDTPPIPEDNRLTKARVELGEKLFFDPALSLDGTISCASCHVPGKAFADNNRIGIGIHGREGFRNVPSLLNIVYSPDLLKDGGNPNLEAQALVPLADHAEMDHDLHGAVKRLSQNEAYQRLSKTAYHRDFDGYTLVKSLAAFQRSLVRANSRFDRFKYYGEATLSTDELAGWEIFQIHCSSCHSGALFSDFSFRNNGLYTHYTDKGRGRITLNPSDGGKFKVPSLRNVAITFPYMHDGSLATLEEVVAHYNSGGESHPNKSEKIRPLNLSEKQEKDLVRFLKSLTDREYTE